MMDKAAILAELDKYNLTFEIARETDVTTADIQERYGCSAGNTPIDNMRRIVADDPDKWELLKVVDRPGSRRWYWVLRKKCQ